MLVKAAFLPMGNAGIYTKLSHQMKTGHFAISWAERVFSQRPGSGWSWWGELDALFSPYDARTFSSSRVSLKTPSPMPQSDSWSSLALPQDGRQAPNLEPSELVFMCFSMMSPGSASTTLVVMPGNSISFLDATIQQPLNNTMKKAGIPIMVVEADYGLISK